ncbi:MAG TPA: 50S ribosomal protein L18 [Anaerolineales bacterium]|jgi:large subunit ribosomal protein L18|nr:50S ribosomal protein L18 [Anaerolineales bacterium]
MASKNKSRNAARIRRHVRVRQNISGTPARPRLNVFRSMKEIYAQVIDDIAGNTLVSASTVDQELREQLKGQKRLDQARLVGIALAERAKAKGITEVAFDRGGYKYIGRVKALADGAREGGLKF